MKTRGKRQPPVIPVSFALPKTWIEAVDVYAARRSSPVERWSRSRAIRALLEVALSSELPKVEVAWPLVPQSLRRGVRKASRIDRRLFVDKKLREAFEKSSTLTLQDIRRLFNHRDTAFVDAALVRLVQSAVVAFDQERTSGRSRVIYRWIKPPPNPRVMRLTDAEASALRQATAKGDDAIVFDNGRLAHLFVTHGVVTQDKGGVDDQRSRDPESDASFPLRGYRLTDYGREVLAWHAEEERMKMEHSR